MELLQLRYFLALAKNENLTKTARELYISPPALSSSLSKLEAELGVQLFHRAGRSLSLNDAGKIFAKHVDNILVELDLAVSKIQKNNVVSVVCDSPALWHAALSDYMDARPNIFVNNRVMKRKLISQDIFLTDFDFWLAYTSPLQACDELYERKLTSNSLYLAVPDTHPLASAKSVSLTDLKDEIFVFPSKGYRAYDIHTNICLDAGFEPKIIANAGFLARMKMVSAGRAISFVEEKEPYQDLFKHIACIDIEDSSAHSLDSIYIYWHKRKELSESALDFLNYISLYFS